MMTMVSDTVGMDTTIIDMVTLVMEATDIRLSYMGVTDIMFLDMMDTNIWKCRNLRNKPRRINITLNGILKTIRNGIKILQWSI
ncbi:hypothetical protein NPIL_478771 [Nephila pilipes]|uniref:Uncharacterized protein n=1 Tax=Nephila pilipes TaxID=299642 RepID=A0A8X6T5N4_NEPPI|nr:hypothetical protein NPIL_478771 [Nephila pilipes]